MNRITSHTAVDLSSFIFVLVAYYWILEWMTKQLDKSHIPVHVMIRDFFLILPGSCEGFKGLWETPISFHWMPGSSSRSVKKIKHWKDDACEMWIIYCNIIYLIITHEFKIFYMFCSFKQRDTKQSWNCHLDTRLHYSIQGFFHRISQRWKYVICLKVHQCWSQA